MLSEFIKESKEFAPLEDNPLVYTLVISKLVQSDKQSVQNDEILYKLLNKVESVIRDVDADYNELKESFVSPAAIYSMFESKQARSAAREYVINSVNAYADVIAAQKKTFEESWEVHLKFNALMESQEFCDFLDSL